MTARAFGSIADAVLSYRHPDREKVPRRHSYDENDDRAQVWQRIGDGTARQGFAFIGAMLETFDALFEDQRVKKYRGLDRLQPLDRHIFKTLMGFVDFASGALFPMLETIAKKSGASKQAVVNALKRLKAHSLVQWVRRSKVVEENEGEAAPQRQQTSNAYFFDMRAMAKRVKQTFIMALTRRLKPMGKVAKELLTPKRIKPQQADPALEMALKALENGLDLRSSESP